MSKARITYRFDKHGNRDEDAVIVPDHDTPEASEPQRKSGHASNRMGADKLAEEQESRQAEDISERSLNQFTQDYGSWTSPYDAEVERLERIIRGDHQDVSKDVGRDEHWDAGWVNGETGYMRVPHRDGPIVTDEAYLPNRRTQKGPPWIRLIASVAGAVVTGVVLGLFVLTLFTDGDADPLPADAEQPLQTGEDGAQAPVDVSFGDIPPESDTNGAADAGGMSTVTNPEWSVVSVPGGSYHMIQYGVFSSAEGARTAVRELSDLGLAGAAGGRNGSWYVYAGVSEDKDDILGLAQQLKQRDFDIYIKQLDIPPVERLQWNGEDASKVTSYFEQAHVLVSKVSALTLLHLQEAQPTGLESTSLESIAGTHQQMMILSSQIAGGFEEVEATRFQAMNNAMNTAVDSMNAYNRNPSRSFLWQAQTAVMRFLLEHDQWVRSFVP